MTTVLGRVDMVTAEDPFGTGDPLEAARLVRRALAAAGQKATDVAELVLVGGDDPGPEALARFARRALGPRATSVPASGHPATARDHEARVRAALGITETRPRARDTVTVVVVRGPGDRVSALCLE